MSSDDQTQRLAKVEKLILKHDDELKKLQTVQTKPHPENPNPSLPKILCKGCNAERPLDEHIEHRIREQVSSAIEDVRKETPTPKEHHFDLECKTCKDNFDKANKPKEEQKPKEEEKVPVKKGWI